ncbi:MAG: glycosyltransferase, partial [Myxococcales bacterium]|nr:glycosyltransferase [Myxococcales bacterium]
CHMPLAGVVGRLVGRITGIPVVYTEHNLQPRYHKATFLANKATWGMQRRVVACSEDVARSIHEHIGHHVPVQVVQNGVATERFRKDPDAGAAVRASLGVPEDARVMSTVAVFRTQKRLTTWLEVARAVLDADDRAHFFLVGDGPLRAEVEAAVDALDLRGRVHLPGLLEDVRPWLSASDVYVMSSEFEGLPVALLEAMSCELPAVTTDVGGINEVVRTGTEGTLVHRDRPLDLAPAVLELFADDGLRASRAAAARARVVEGFGMGRMMGELEAIYREVVA